MDTSLLQRETAPAPEGNNSGPINLSDDPVEDVRELFVPPRQLPIHLTLTPPIEYDGKTYREITCDFESLLGVDYIRAEREFRHGFKPVTKNEIPFPQMNPDFHVILISYAADVPVGVIKKLPFKPFAALQSESLKACGSSVDEDKE